MEDRTMTTRIEDTRMDEMTERAAMERRIEALERQVRDLEEWLTELADDVLDRQGVA
jgi:polyhydroxyalkanoate synthesis regulator phasin